MQQAITPITKSAQYASIATVLGSAATYLKGTIFLDNGDGTCTPQGGKDIFATDANFFTPFDPANPVPLSGQTFWAFDGMGNILQVGNDGSQEANGFIKAGIFFFTQQAALNALQAIQQMPKQ